MEIAQQEKLQQLLEWFDVAKPKKSVRLPCLICGCEADGARQLCKKHWYQFRAAKKLLPKSKQSAWDRKQQELGKVAKPQRGRKRITDNVFV